MFRSYAPHPVSTRRSRTKNVPREYNHHMRRSNENEESSRSPERNHRGHRQEKYYVPYSARQAPHRASSRQRRHSKEYSEESESSDSGNDYVQYYTSQVPRRHQTNRKLKYDEASDDNTSDDNNYTPVHSFTVAPLRKSRNRSEFRSPQKGKKLNVSAKPADQVAKSVLSASKEDSTATDDQSCNTAAECPTGQDKSSELTTQSNNPDAKEDSAKEADQHSEKAEQSETNEESEHEVEPMSFETLPKATLVNMMHVVGIKNISGNVYDIAREIAGSFLQHVVSAASEHREEESLGSSVIEPIVEQMLGHKPDDLEQSYISLNVFTRFLNKLCDMYNVNLKKEATLYLHNATEYMLLCSFQSAMDIAHNARRVRVTVKDLALATKQGLRF